MRKADRAELGKYVRFVADNLGLRDWTFVLRHTGCADDAHATVTPTEGRKVAVIEFSKDFRSEDPDVQRSCVVHELIHCHHAAASDIVRKDTLKWLSQDSYELLVDGYKRQIEYMTDGIAMAIAEHYPHIDWPAKAAATKPEGADPMAKKAAFGGKKAAPFKKGGGRVQAHPNTAKGTPRKKK